jgi:hypothetical protein
MDQFTGMEKIKLPPPFQLIFQIHKREEIEAIGKALPAFPGPLGHPL